MGLLMTPNASHLMGRPWDSPHDESRPMGYIAHGTAIPSVYPWALLWNVLPSMGHPMAQPTNLLTSRVAISWAILQPINIILDVYHGPIHNISILSSHRYCPMWQTMGQPIRYLISHWMLLYRLSHGMCIGYSLGYTRA